MSTCKNDEIFREIGDDVEIVGQSESVCCHTNSFRDRMIARSGKMPIRKHLMRILDGGWLQFGVEIIQERVAMQSFLQRSILKVAGRSRHVTELAAFITRNATAQTHIRDTYGYLRERFLANGENHPVDRAAREKLVAAFETVDREVAVASSPTDGLFMAEMLINMKAEGDIVECGCFSGGSSAKLSLVAKLLGRKIIVFDSFEGLPAVEQQYLRDQHCRRSEAWVADWSEGRYAARIDLVKSNVERFGDISVASFVKGWFSDTLTPENLPERVAFAFVDVDLANSARDCFTVLWPRLSDGGIYVTHDTAYIKVLQVMYDPDLWRNRFQAIPPILFGAGFGLCNDSPHIGYMVKGESLTPEYLKSLTIDK